MAVQVHSPDVRYGANLAGVDGVLLSTSGAFSALVSLLEARGLPVVSAQIDTAFYPTTGDLPGAPATNPAYALVAGSDPFVWDGVAWGPLLAVYPVGEWGQILGAAQNLNASIPGAPCQFTLASFTSSVGGAALFTPVATGLLVNETCNVSVSFMSTFEAGTVGVAARVNVGHRLTTGGTLYAPLIQIETRSGYIRDANGHNESSNTYPEVTLPVTLGQVIGFSVRRLSTSAAAVYQALNGAILRVEKAG